MRMTNLLFLLVGAPSPLQGYLADACARDGASVRILPETADAADMREALSVKTEKLRVVFTPCGDDETALLEADLADGGRRLEQIVATRCDAFLRQMQAALSAMMQAGSGQIWVCDIDDGFAYHAPIAVAPIQAQARAGAVRSLAKEYSRMGIAVNSIFTHPLVFPEEDVRMYRSPGLKSYAMRYKPSPASDLLDFFATHAQSDRLPFTGASQSFGMGVAQAHLSL